MIYYIDRIHGDPAADGLSPETARLTYTDLPILPGDTVLFRRGTVVRETLKTVAGEAGKPVTYGAWGEGHAPIFRGSLDVSDPADWEEIRPHVWQYKGNLPSEACNFIFDGDPRYGGERVGATLRWEIPELCEQGDWHDEAIGKTERRQFDPHRQVLLWSEKNPGEYYSHIECAVHGERGMAKCPSHTRFEDLAFENSGVHGIAGTAVDVEIRRCSFCFIGGCVWNRQLKIRFGNGIEFWNTGDHMIVEDCFFNNIYDSCTTHQGAGTACVPVRDVHYRRNLFMNYGMGAYEVRDHMAVDSSFVDNICVRAIGGFSPMGDTVPRRSEIWPQPMGHHLFLWRIPAAAPGGRLEVKRNIFWDAPQGAAIYSIISPEAEAQMEVDENIYYTENTRLLNTVGGKSYAPSQWEEYRAATGWDKNSRMEKMELSSLLDTWFALTGVSREAVTETMATVLPKYYITGDTDRDAASYAVGETVIFRIRLTRDDGETASCPVLRIRRRGDDGETDECFVSGMTGHAEYATSLKMAGFVRISVTACHADHTPIPGITPFEGGAAANVTEVVQAGGEPADFDMFWKRVLETELDPVAPEFVQKQEFVCGDPGDIVYDVRIASPGPANVSGYLRMPRNAAPGSLPIQVNYRGYGVRSADVPHKAKALVLNLNQQGTDNGLPVEYYNELRFGKFNNWGFGEKENASPDTCDFKYLLLRALQAVRAMMTLPEWDGKTVVVNGGSMGAFQSVFVAAMEPKITKATIQIPWMCDLEAAAKLGRLRGWRPADAPAMPYYDTVNLAKRLQCPVIIDAGLGDDTCPPSGAAALLHAISAQKKLTLWQGRTHHYAMPGACRTECP